MTYVVKAKKILDDSLARVKCLDGKMYSKDFLICLIERGEKVFIDREDGTELKAQTIRDIKYIKEHHCDKCKDILELPEFN